MNDMQSELYAKLCVLTTEQVVNAFLDWHGNQLLTEGFSKHVCEEYFDGYDVPEEEESEEDE